jgi:class 3 adenylate cyclase
MKALDVYIPIDRRQAMARGTDLPDRARGAALFADISGFTPLTEALVQELGPQRGADELTRQLNRVYDALIAEVHRYGGSVIGFSGDAITCWFDDDPSTALRQSSGQGSGQAPSTALLAELCPWP